MRKNIIVTLQIAGVHQWKECLIEEVSYLRDLHRHVFYITCKVAVESNDRQIEIIRFKNRVLNYVATEWGRGNRECNFENMSCEAIAEQLVKHFNLSYCKVLEDNENGAEVINER
jgi:hypothetical protein